jgi:hypothetical protein
VGLTLPRIVRHHPTSDSGSAALGDQIADFVWEPAENVGFGRSDCVGCDRQLTAIIANDLGRFRCGRNCVGDRSPCAGGGQRMQETCLGPI